MMTLVVKVEGDPDHQIRVGRCMANGGGQELQLSDDAGCPLRPKLMSGNIIHAHKILHLYKL